MQRDYKAIVKYLTAVPKLKCVHVWDRREGICYSGPNSSKNDNSGYNTAPNGSNSIQMIES